MSAYRPTRLDDSTDSLAYERDNIRHLVDTKQVAGDRADAMSDWADRIDTELADRS